MTRDKLSLNLSSTDSTVTIAGPLRRLLALMYDCFLLLGVLFIATLIPAFFSGLLNTPQGEQIYDLPPLFQGAGFTAYLLAIIVLFFGYFWRKSGQTLGMQAWRIKVIDIHGGSPSWSQCIIRALTAVFSLLLGGLGYWWIFIDKDQCAWQDHTSNTRVIVLPKH